MVGKGPAEDKLVARRRGARVRVREDLESFDLRVARRIIKHGESTLAVTVSSEGRT